ncbi:MAG TPA: hypothetical protein VK335_21735 [Bryobacteraceae bacterium]|nr:hypothetical protein [Bryobacteraceae bacterium]
MWIVLSLLLGASAAGRKAPPSAPKVLQPSVSRSLTVPSFSYFGEGQCDKAGNLYFHYVGAGEFRVIHVVGLSAAGTEGTSFKPSGALSDPDKAGFESFSVTPGGDVYILARTRTDKTQIFQFGPDGIMNNPTTLEIPDGVFANDIAAYDNGAILFSGYYEKAGPGHAEGGSYVAVFGPSGKLIKEVPVPLPNVNPSEPTINNGGQTLSADGNVYFVGPNKVFVISRVGEVVRTIPFEKPDPKLVATKIYTSREQLVIVVNRIEDTGAVHPSYLALNGATGERLGYYAAPDEPGLTDVCLSAEGLTFMQFDNGRTKLLTAPLK